jgi:hypothetical protein
LRNLTPEELRSKLPKLLPDNHETKSKATPRYNCVAFANGDERHWWEPGLFGGAYYWPPNIKQSDELESWVEMFTVQGYKPTKNRKVEPGYEKVAIYVDLTDMLPSHVAVSDGRVWKSKLGKGQDIYHSSLDVLEGTEKDEYGIVERVLKRPIK